MWGLHPCRCSNSPWHREASHSTVWLGYLSPTHLPWGKCVRNAREVGQKGRTRLRIPSPQLPSSHPEGHHVPHLSIRHPSAGKAWYTCTPLRSSWISHCSCRTSPASRREKEGWRHGQEYRVESGLWGCLVGGRREEGGISSLTLRARPSSSIFTLPNCLPPSLAATLGGHLWNGQGWT